jgi:hypothetical protein
VRFARSLRPPSLRLGPAIAAALLAGCGLRGELRGDVYRDGSVVFRIGELPAPWQRVQVADGQLAFHHRAGGTILAHATCEPHGDPSLEVLTRHLLIGIEAPRELSQAALSLDGRRALRTRVDGRLDGVAVAFDLVVLKKDGCTYDLALAAAPAVFASRRSDFERFFQGFARVPS